MAGPWWTTFVSQANLKFLKNTMIEIGSEEWNIRDLCSQTCASHSWRCIWEPINRMLSRCPASGTHNRRLPSWRNGSRCKLSLGSTCHDEHGANTYLSHCSWSKCISSTVRLWDCHLQATVSLGGRWSWTIVLLALVAQAQQVVRVSLIFPITGSRRGCFALDSSFDVVSVDAEWGRPGD